MAMHICARQFPTKIGRRLLKILPSMNEILSSELNAWIPSRSGEHVPSPKIKDVLRTSVDMIRNIGEELSKFKDEVSDHFRGDNYFDYRHGDYKYVFKLNDRQSIAQWTTTTDRVNKDGYSTGNFVLSKTNTGIFHGTLNTEVPKDGKQKAAGYVNIRSPHNILSFKRRIPYNWDPYTHLVIRTRGDGRAYMICIQMDHYFDVTWLDMYNFPLYTRGGPYWQITKIPFSKFYLSNKGRVQDKQERVHLDKIRNISITAADSINGPFQLELDYIACLRDTNNVEDFAYEMYRDYTYYPSEED